MAQKCSVHQLRTAPNGLPFRRHPKLHAIPGAWSEKIVHKGKRLRGLETTRSEFGSLLWDRKLA